MTRRSYAGGAARTTITGSIPSSGGGTVTIAASTGWPDGSGGKFHVVVDPGLSSEEKILMDSRSGTTLTFSAGGRAADGSTATSHSSTATIWLCYTAVDADEANAHVNATASSHAATAISFSPTGTIAGTTVQAAVAEVASEAGSRLDSIEANNWVIQARMADGSVGTGELIDASVTNAKLLLTDIVSLTRAANQSLSGVGGSITWDTEVADTEGWLTVSSDTLTVPASKDGLYLISYNAISGSSAAATPYCYAGPAAGNHLTVGGAGFAHIGGNVMSLVRRLAAGDTIVCGVTGISPGAINFTATLKITRLSL